MYFYSQISCKAVGKVLYNSTFKGRENGPRCVKQYERVAIAGYTETNLNSDSA